MFHIESFECAICIPRHKVTQMTRIKITIWPRKDAKYPQLRMPSGHFYTSAFAYLFSQVHLQIRSNSVKKRNWYGRILWAKMKSELQRQSRNFSYRKSSKLRLIFSLMLSLLQLWGYKRPGVSMVFILSHNPPLSLDKLW